MRHPRHGRLLAGLLLAGAVAPQGRSADACPPDPQGIAAGCSGLPGPAQTPEREGVAHPSPAVEGEGQRDANDRGHNPEDAALPVRIIKSIVEAEHDKARATEADKNDAKNLQTRIRTAKATEKQAIAAQAAVAISLIGSLLLIGTLWESRRANKLNRAAYIADQRPWGAVEVATNGKITWDDAGLTIPLRFTFENVGKTPALRVAFACDSVADESVIREEEAAPADRELRQTERRGADHHDLGVLSTVFPGKGATLEHPPRFIPQVALDNAARGKDAARRLFEPACGIRPTFVGCVTYRRTFDESIAQTSSSFYAFRKEGEGERKGFLPSHLPLAPEQAGDGAGRTAA